MASAPPLPADSLTITEVAAHTGLSPDTQLTGRIRPPQASGRALDGKIAHYEKLLGERSCWGNNDPPGTV